MSNTSTPGEDDSSIVPKKEDQGDATITTTTEENKSMKNEDSSDESSVSTADEPVPEKNATEVIPEDVPQIVVDPATSTTPEQTAVAVTDSISRDVSAESDLQQEADDADEYTPAMPTEAEVIASLRPALKSNTGNLSSRLPQDKVGMLEDRIQADPKGDMEAWLALLGEHRKRNKLDEARKIYERFFKVFPTAVRTYSHIDSNYADTDLG
jgi:cleavage stimulation factor subunit 3